MFLKKLKEDDPDLTSEEIIEKFEAYKKSNRGGSNDDTGKVTIV